MALATLLLPFLLASVFLLVMYFILAGGENYRVALKLIYDILRNPSEAHETITSRLEYYGGTVYSTYLLITSDPRNAHHVFGKHHSNYPKGAEFKEKLDFLGEGIFNADGEFGLFQRRILHSILNSPTYEQFLTTTLRRKIESGLFPVLHRAAAEGTVLDMQDVFNRFMFDNICTTVLGYDPNYLTVDLHDNLPYARAYEDILKAGFYRHVIPDFLWKFQRAVGIGEERKLRQASERFDHFLYGRIKLKRDSFRETESKTEENRQFDLLTSFMQAAEEHEGGEIESAEIRQLGKSDKFMRDTAFNFIFAGKESVSSTLVWLVWLIISNHDVAEKVLEEIRANLGENRDANWRFFGEEELSKLVYLHGAVCETLRLYPSVPFEHRTAVEAETLPSGHKVGKNARVLFSIYSMGRMEEIWGKDWREFRPERWLDSKGKKIIHVPSYKFMAFLAGPRACLGKQSTFEYVKQVTSALLYNYKVELVDGHSVAPVASVSLPMKDGLKVRVSKRR